jgi:2-oxoglutarate dehydrogenase E2 component (dihydrolipoamide succinyltransferase)
MDVIMPQLGETVQEGTVTVWHKKAGDRIEAGEPLFEVTTEKVDTEVPSPASGVLAAILVAEGQTVKVGAKLALIEEAGKAQSAAPASAAVSDGAAKAAPRSAPARASALPPRRDDDARLSPVVRRLIAEHQLDPSDIRGTGADGRITRSDVLAHIQGRQANSTAPRSSGDGQSAPLTKIRKRTAQQMVLSWTTVPHVLQAVEVDFQAVERARNSFGEAWKKKEGWALTYLPFVAHAVCSAIAEFPAVNASFDGDSLVLHRPINLGIAVDLGAEGLIAPVVKDAATKSLPELARVIRALAEKARARQLGPDDVTEGTYTLSNSGRFGTFLTAPIVNLPQVAILSIDGVAKKPVVIEGPEGDTIAIRPVGVLAQSFDHRAFDGAYSAAFLNRLKAILESKDWSASLA